MQVEGVMGVWSVHWSSDISQFGIGNLTVAFDIGFIEEWEVNKL